MVGRPLADVCRIGIETSLVDDGGLGAGTSIADVWRIGVETSLECVLRIGASTSLWRGTETSVAWHVIGTDGPSMFATDTDVPDNAKTGLGLYVKHVGSRCKSASTSSALSPSRSVS